MSNIDIDIETRVDIAKAKLQALGILYEYAKGVDDTDKLIEIKEEAHRIRMLTDEEFLREVRHSNE